MPDQRDRGERAEKANLHCYRLTFLPPAAADLRGITVYGVLALRTYLAPFVYRPSQQTPAQHQTSAARIAARVKWSNTDVSGLLLHASIGTYIPASAQYHPGLKKVENCIRGLGGCCARGTGSISWLKTQRPIVLTVVYYGPKFVRN